MLFTEIHRPTNASIQKFSVYFIDKQLHIKQQTCSLHHVSDFNPHKNIQLEKRTNSDKLKKLKFYAFPEQSLIASNRFLLL